jgi:hypothetical protein
MATWTEFAVWRERQDKKFVAAMVASYASSESGAASGFVAILFQERDPGSPAASYELVYSDQTSAGEFARHVRPRPCLPVQPNDIVWPGGPPRHGDVEPDAPAEPMVAASRVSELLTGLFEQCDCSEIPAGRTGATGAKLIAANRIARSPRSDRAKRRVREKRARAR